MGRYGKNMRSCCDSPDQRLSPHIRGCTQYRPTDEDRLKDARKHDAETFRASRP